MIKTEMAKAGDMNKAEAQALTERIRNGVEDIRKLVAKAHDGKAWKALSYASWEDYVKSEFGMSRSYAHRLISQGEVIEAIENAVGNLSPIGNISEGAARELKADLPAAMEEIKRRVEKGEEAARAAKEIAATRRAEKEKAREVRKAQQAENDRQREEVRAALPPSVQRVEQAKQRNGATNAAVAGVPAADRIAELEDAVRSLEAENARLKEEIKLFAEMKAEWEKGGFAEVIRGKDEVIATLKTRVERESGDKASWKHVSDMWKQRALDAGWSNELKIDIETGAIVNG